MAFVIKILLLCLAIAVSDAGELCNTNDYCPYYCCRSTFQNECCSTCSRSIYYHPECTGSSTTRRTTGETCNTNDYCPYYCCAGFYQNVCCSTCSLSVYYHPECTGSSTTRRTTTSSSTSNAGSIIGVILSFIFFVTIAVLIVCCCCGCICSSRTGIQRKGKVVIQPASNITVISQNQTTFQSPVYNNPQPLNTYPPFQPVANQNAPTNMYPPYPANQQYYPPNYPVYNNNIMPPVYKP